MMKRAVYYIVLTGVVLASLLFLGFSVFALLPPVLPKIVTLSDKIKTSEISSMEYIKIGGVDQWIAILGRDISKPVLLFLHGGPGMPETAWFLEYNLSLTEDFVVVLWEQRGAGKSFTKNVVPDMMKPDTFVEDVHELTAYLKKRFMKEKIYLTGHSWGSLIGLMCAARYPGDFYAFIGTGTPVGQQESELLGYRWVLSNAIASGDMKAVQELKMIGAPTNGFYAGGVDSLIIERKWVQELGGTIKGQSAIAILSKILLFSGVYTMEDKFRYLMGTDFSLRYLWEQALAIDINAQSAKINVPVYLIHGQYDCQAFLSVVKKYFLKMKAQVKKLIVFDESAHFPMFEEPKKFHEIMTNIVLKETLSKKK
ncbi:MAG: hypothetical protein A2Y33_10485 [Spirochaetes bacterium GWF1_51_8]|nr:MAG: hypothetical protein A2Y33_10485 [Spirochaetes bacterium GWF1_51_8]